MHTRGTLYRLGSYVIILFITFNVYLFSSSDFWNNKIDWHDHEFIMYENSRVGRGEKGTAVTVLDATVVKANEAAFLLDGIYTITNSLISPYRSLPDARLEVCKTREYLRNLPTTSVVIVFFSENLELLVRCLHSIHNRSPKELLKEIILINDASPEEILGVSLKQYVDQQFNGVVKYSINSVRKGLLASRDDGAKQATGEVVVFLDSHMEMTVNWLAPLLEPIRIDSKTATVPMIDSLDPKTFEYENLGHGSRGSFDWTLTHQLLKLTDEYQKVPGDNYQLSVMTGNAFAIDKEWFLHLGGYEEGLIVWSDRFEMSFKLHLCGGNLIQVPCSHVAHTNKSRSEQRDKIYGPDNSAKKLKRVAEIWMDEYKEVFYNKTSDIYKDVDAGDLTEAFALKKQLQCKPFKHFIDKIASDLTERFPPFEKDNFATGAIRSDVNSTLCITNDDMLKSLKLQPCERNPVNPSSSQYFEFTWHRSIQFPNYDGEVCLDSENATLKDCHYDFGSQLWKYDLGTHQLINIPSKNCISTNGKLDAVEMRPCDMEDSLQKFSWGSPNLDALENWDIRGRKLNLN